jgi:predicted PurR-regulated permease PerM
MQNQPSEIKRQSIETGFSFMLLLVLIYAFYNSISVFLGVFTFAIIFSVSFHGLFEKIVGRFGGRRKLAAFFYGLLLVAIIALPFIYGASILGKGIYAAQEFIAGVKNHQIPALPGYVSEIPYAGPKITKFWLQLESNPEATISTYEPQIRNFLQRLLSGGAGIAGTGLELIIGIIISAIFLFNGPSMVRPLELILARLAGEKGSLRIINATGRAIKGVAVGVMGTGLIAGFAAWIGYRIAGFDIAPILAVITFFLVVIQLGPVLVLIPTIAWLATQGHSGSAIFLSIYGLVVLMGIDNVLKPILIGRSGKLPILVLFLGVIGGMAAWGFTGMFKGAIIMAVCYTLFQSWFNVQKDEPVPEEATKEDVLLSA